jgi:tetratricopeptide (TPR) repeat protein
MEKTTIHLIALMRDRVGILCKEGNIHEARHSANAAVERAEVELNSDMESIVAFACTLEVRADFFRSLSEWELARDDYKQAIDQLEAWPQHSEQIGRLYAGLGAVHDSLGNTPRAIELWELAIQNLEKTAPNASLQAAAVMNNLAYLKKSTGNRDGAEKALLKALEIMHRMLGPNDMQTASVCNNLGALYLQKGYHEQAREMHHMALEARKKCLGDAHEDTAQSYNNLALALIKTGDVAMARQHFQRAISGLEACSPIDIEMLRDVADNYISFLRNVGEDPVAEIVERRFEEIALQSR